MMTSEKQQQQNHAQITQRDKVSLSNENEACKPYVPTTVEEQATQHKEDQEEMDLTNINDAKLKNKLTIINLLSLFWKDWCQILV